MQATFNFLGEPTSSLHTLTVIERDGVVYQVDLVGVWR